MCVPIVSMFPPLSPFPSPPPTSTSTSTYLGHCSCRVAQACRGIGQIQNPPNFHHRWLPTGLQVCNGFLSTLSHNDWLLSIFLMSLFSEKLVSTSKSTSLLKWMNLVESVLWMQPKLPCLQKSSDRKYWSFPSCQLNSQSPYPQWVRVLLQYGGGCSCGRQKDQLERRGQVSNQIHQRSKGTRSELKRECPHQRLCSQLHCSCTRWGGS